MEIQEFRLRGPGQHTGGPQDGRREDGRGGRRGSCGRPGGREALVPDATPHLVRLTRNPGASAPPTVKPMLLGLTSRCRIPRSCGAARASANRATTDTPARERAARSRRRSSSVPPASVRMYRESRGGERPRCGVSCVRRRGRRPAGCGIRWRSATRRFACWRGPRRSRPSEGHLGRTRESWRWPGLQERAPPGAGRSSSSMVRRRLRRDRLVRMRPFRLRH